MESTNENNNPKLKSEVVISQEVSREKERKMRVLEQLKIAKRLRSVLEKAADSSEQATPKEAREILLSHRKHINELVCLTEAFKGSYTLESYQRYNSLEALKEKKKQDFFKSMDHEIKIHSDALKGQRYTSGINKADLIAGGSSKIIKPNNTEDQGSQSEAKDNEYSFAISSDDMKQNLTEKELKHARKRKKKSFDLDNISAYSLKTYSKDTSDYEGYKKHRYEDTSSTEKTSLEESAHEKNDETDENDPNEVVKSSSGSDSDYTEEATNNNDIKVKIIVSGKIFNEGKKSITARVPQSNNLSTAKYPSSRKCVSENHIIGNASKSIPDNANSTSLDPSSKAVANNSTQKKELRPRVNLPPRRCHNCTASKTSYLRCHFWFMNGNKCGKIFCKDCLANSYELEDYESILSDLEWHCPSCLGICQCKACVRQRNRSTIKAMTYSDRRSSSTRSSAGFYSL